MISKGPTRKQEKARRDRRERKVIKAVRPQVERRDGRCRLATSGHDMLLVVGPCRGESEWAHLPSHRRSKTRGQAPEERHTTAGSLMLCDGHHDALDEHRLEVEAMTDRGADGPLLWTADAGRYEEPA